MSLEEAIRENTAAVSQMREAILMLVQSVESGAVATASEYVVDQSKLTPEMKEGVNKYAAAAKTHEPKVAPKKANKKPEPETVAEEPAAEEETPAEDKPLDYQADVVPLLTKLAQDENHGREAVVDLFARFGVRKGSELDAGQLPAVVARTKELLGE